MRAHFARRGQRGDRDAANGQQPRDLRGKARAKGVERDGREAKQRALLQFGADPGDHEQSERRAARAALRPKARHAKTHADGSEQRQQPDRPPRLRLHDQHERINIAENHREQQPAETRDDHRPKQAPDRGRRGCRGEGQRRRVHGERRPGGLPPQQRKQKGRAQAQDDQPVPVEALERGAKTAAGRATPRRSRPRRQKVQDKSSGDFRDINRHRQRPRPPAP